MKTFRFPLEKALEWRRRQLEVEELKFRQLSAGLQELDQRRAALESARDSAGRKLIESRAVTGSDLNSLAGYRSALRIRGEALLLQRRQQETCVEEQRHKYQEARRQCRLLEKLRERRRAQWQADCNRELEALASESFLSKWNRGRPL
ncbi:MAG: hypothetical protein M1541_06695 [Acidobacteria bacterium]|nr:hypothetical protein [Acidobacteriota bacterium]